MRRWRGWAACVAAVVVMGVSGGVRAQEQGAKPATGEAGGEPAVETRTYNVVDLVRTAPDYPFQSEVKPPTGWVQRGGGDAVEQVPGGPGPYSGMGGNRMERASTGKPGIGMAELITVIERSVEPKSWMELGGAVGTVQPLGSLLVVTQTAENQKRVEELLGMIRKEYGPLKTVGVRVRWLLLTPEQAGSVVGGKKGAVGVVDEDAVGKLPAEALWAAGRTACFSGQTVYVASGLARTVMTKASPVVGTNAAAYDVTAELMQSGAVLQVTPLLAPDGQTAVLDLASVATDWGPMEGGAIEVGGVAVGGRVATTRPAARLDRVTAGVQQMRTTVRVPVGKMVVVGGMTREPGADGRQLYLVAEVEAGE